jgi:hypothetical protein
MRGGGGGGCGVSANEYCSAHEAQITPYLTFGYKYHHFFRHASYSRPKIVSQTNQNFYSVLVHRACTTAYVGI